MSQETITKNVPYVHPEQSRELIRSFIVNFGREDEPKASPHPVPVHEVFVFEDKNNLFFGPGTDALDYVLSREDWDFKFDAEKGTITYNPTV